MVRSGTFLYAAPGAVAVAACARSPPQLRVALVGRKAGTVARTKRRTRRTAPVRWCDERLVLELVGTAPYHTVRTVGF